ncbi:MAG: hypothetical protein JW734_09290 [Candidatus Omnitrophica bacterium]|nr:hypothetical protein [Candidatus Omnitrophota bacterium]
MNKLSKLFLVLGLIFIPIGSYLRDCGIFHSLAILSFLASVYFFVVRKKGG